MERDELLKKLKKAMGVAGIICGTLGILAAIVMYFVLSPLVDRLGAAAVMAMEHTTSAVDGATASLNSALDSVESLHKFSISMSASIGSLENASSKFSSSILNLSRNLGILEPSLPGDSLEQLNESAASFSEFSTQLESARSPISSMSSATNDMASNINSTRDSIAATKADINEFKDTLNVVVGELKLALLVGTFILILFFLTLMCYSAGILL